MKNVVAVGALVVVLAAAMLVFLSSGPPSAPDILIITIDTLRADALEPYGATDTLTPNIAALAGQGVVYESATTPMPLTRPAHCSIMTGLYPDQHDVLTNHQILPENVVTLAERLRETGYQTAGFTGIRFLNRRSGLGRGFDKFKAPTKTEKLRAKDVVDRARAWLEGADPETPIFLWVHVFDPHQPYNPLRTFRRDIDPELEKQIPLINYNALNRVARDNNGDIPEHVFNLVQDYYRFEVEYTDFWIGRLMQNFDRLRQSQSSLVVLTADHGECFENGIYFDHADCLYEGALRVPLIVRYPDGMAGGMRVDRRVSNLDITPTVLSELSLPLPEEIAGVPLQTDFSGSQRSSVLVRLPERPNPEREHFRLRVIRSVVSDPVAAETDPQSRGVVDLLWKYLWAPDSEYLFKLPDERSNQAIPASEVRKRMHQVLRELMTRYPAVGEAPNDQDPETLEALEALGYVQ